MRILLSNQHRLTISLAKEDIIESPVRETKIGPAKEIESRGFTRAKRIKIVIVEDIEDLINLYRTVLSSHGYEVQYCFESGEEVIQAATQGRLMETRIVIMDYRLKQVNGMEAAKALLKYHPGLSIVIASADESINDEAVGIGFVYLRKPFTMDELLNSVKRAADSL